MVVTKESFYAKNIKKETNLLDIGLMWRCPMGLSSGFYPGTRAVCSRGAPSVSCMGPSDVAGLTSVVILAGWAGPQSRWLLDSASSGGC